MSNFSLSLLYFLLEAFIMETMELMAVEYAITPISISTTLNACSSGVLLFISPYPTVVIVATMKYKEAKYCSAVDAL